MRRIPSLDGLRAISISLVVVGHWISLRYNSDVALSYAILGVRIFFVISGYLITTLLLQEHEETNTIRLREFYVRRAYRIFPAAGVFMLSVFVMYRHDLHWYHAAAAALYVANFDPLRPWFLGHLWSLSVEEQFYFLWPSVLRTWYRHRIPILAGAIAVAPLYQVACFLLKVSGGGAEHFPAVANYLAAGCLLAIAAPRIPVIRRWAGLLLLLPIVLIPSYLAVSRSRTLLLLFLLWPLLQFSIAGFLLHVVQQPYRVLNFTPMVWLGKISYSLYLWQQLFAYNPHHRPWYFMLVPVGLASLSYHLVEQPMLRLRAARKAGALVPLVTDRAPVGMAS